jgi:hypothetical protein
VEVKLLRQRGTAAETIVAMVIAALIAYAIIFHGPDILQSIRRGVVGIGTVPLGDIVENPSAYENQRITTIGRVVGGAFRIGEVFDGEGNVMKVVNLQRAYFGFEYKVVGEVVFFPRFSVYDNFPFFQDTWVIRAIEITRI